MPNSTLKVQHDRLIEKAWCEVYENLLARGFRFQEHKRVMTRSETYPPITVHEKMLIKQERQLFTIAHSI